MAVSRSKNKLRPKKWVSQPTVTPATSPKQYIPNHRSDTGSCQYNTSLEQARLGTDKSKACHRQNIIEQGISHKTASVDCSSCCQNLALSWRCLMNVIVNHHDAQQGSEELRLHKINLLAMTRQMSSNLKQE